MREKLLWYAIKYQGNYNQIKRAISDNEAYEVCDYEGKYLCILDQTYPKCLLALKQPPYVLFYEGDIRLLGTKKIAVIGSRKMSTLGKTYCEILAKYIDKEYTVVSGLARGVDGYIHELLMNKQNCIGVIGCGLDYIYPKENNHIYKEMKKNHLLISEYPNGTKPLAYHFPMRNRLLAALSDKVVVVEASCRSGTMLTVNESLLLDKEVYCFPYPFDLKQTSGCNQMIEEGANVLIDAKSIKEL